LLGKHHSAASRICLSRIETGNSFVLILALAADHSIQGRIAAIRKEFESATAGNSVNLLDLNMQSRRESLMALAPKRLLTKIIKAHVPLVDKENKTKSDPFKKWALGSTKVSVPCIENIALMAACDWRRRFGSSQESERIVSMAVGLLHGKVDESSSENSMKAIMVPTCEVPSVASSLLRGCGTRFLCPGDLRAASVFEFSMKPIN
jgi:hypothetical protein